MGFILKIVEGPNKGAEIALAEGVAVTLGKSDDCDIILADAAMPDNAVSIEASADAVTIDGSALELFHVKTLGATSFAAGPSDAPWGELVWPEAKKEESDEKPAPKAEEGEETISGEALVEDGKPKDEPPAKRRGCLGCLFVLALLCALLLGAAWIFRAQVKPYAFKARERAVSVWGWMKEKFSKSEASGAAEGEAAAKAPDIKQVAAKYGCEYSVSNGVERISGNFKTRSERLSATAEVYGLRPGAEIDFSDDESFRSACEDALFTLTEGALRVKTATNRVLSATGFMPSPADLKKTLEALNADVPKLRKIDVSGAATGNAVVQGKASQGKQSAKSRQKETTPSMPVCGILTKPYPCLVMRDGRRILEGAAIGGSVIMKIEADSVILTNSAGRVVWKP